LLRSWRTAASESFDFVGTPIRFTQRLKKGALRKEGDGEPRRITKHEPRHSDKRKWRPEKKRDRR
jgi:hypothetical protein